MLGRQSTEDRAGVTTACIRSRRTLFIALMALGGVLAPGLARAQSVGASRAGRAEPASRAAGRYVVYDKNAVPRWVLIGVGGALLGMSYALPCAQGGGVWCVPVAGPILYVKQRSEDEADNANAGDDGIVPPVFVYTVFGFVSVVQAASLAMITTGALLPRRPVRRSIARVDVTPVVGPKFTGLGVSGRW